MRHLSASTPAPVHSSNAADNGSSTAPQEGHGCSAAREAQQAARQWRPARASHASIAAAAVGAAALLVVGSGPAWADADAVVPMNGCPALAVLGVQGTSESSETADPHALTGMLGTMFGPMLADGTSIEQIDIPYHASFGGAPGTGPDSAPFATSYTQASDRLNATAAAVSQQCPQTKIAVAGYSQGAGVVSDFAREVGAGQGPVSPDSVAGVALFSDMSRAPGADPLPGRPGQSTPDAPPGTAGVNTSRIQLPPVPASGGIASDTEGYGSLSGRVGQFCSAGDLSCDAPGHAAALRTVAGVAAQADLRDPVAAVTTMSSAWSSTVGKATTQVVLDDVDVSGGQVNYAPQQTVSDRLAADADPRTQAPTPDQAQQVSDKIGQIAAAVAADPMGQVPRLVGQVVAAVGANVAANADIVNPAVVAHYADVIGRHRSYSADGQTQQAADWFAAMSQDLTGGGR